MNIDLERVELLTSFVDRLIQIRNISDLSEDCISELITEAISFSGAVYSDAEIDAAKRDITSRYQIRTTPGESILLDYEMDQWYDEKKSDIVPFFWSRYKNYLIDKMHFSPNVVSVLGEETLDRKLMNYILNPEINTSTPILRRGLIIGDVQSGKTSTYIGFICKAADAGYKVFILLTGTIESLRKQTQERVEEGFIGIDMSATPKGGRRVGVGEDNKPIHAMALTSRKGDFTGDSDQIAVALSDKNAVVFVIKKQKDVLTKLRDWLVSLNADPVTGKIDVPMLMIDDEADNASINTSKSKEDPTTINKLIRELANIFTKSNYVGFTATPFANVFIDPETTEKMENQDLFPEDFIVSLPTPSNYIGPNRIFAETGEFHSQLNYINDAGREEEDGFPFYFKHKKEWEGDLPESLTDAMYCFYLANAIRDLRGDIKTHRSMLINISRFVRVQKYIQSVVEEIHSAAYRAIKFNLSDDFEESMKDPIIKRIYTNWEKQYSKIEFTWEDIADILFNSIENIQIKVVNSSKNSQKLEYPKNDSVRVIAIGGLALSRGLTLEGLIVSYFYRNTCTYDVLMQMGRWFGYRKNYEDLFRIWIHKSSAEWYAEIADATEKLKDDMAIMRDLNQKPRDFGIRVRNNSAELNITAYNKMRNATDEYEFSSYFGGFFETPYLHLDVDIEKANYKQTERFISYLVNAGFPFERQKVESGKGHFIIQKIPKVRIVEYIRSIKVSKYCTDFDTRQIANFIENTDDESISEFDIAFMEGGQSKSDSDVINIAGREIVKVKRNNCIIDHDSGRLGVGRRGKLGGPSDGKTGIVDFGGKNASDIIKEAKEEFKRDYYKKNGEEFDEGNKTYPSNFWFRYIKDRRPIILIYLIALEVKEDEQTQKKQIDEFNERMMGIPAVGLALGIPKNDEATAVYSVRYKANKVYNWFEQEEILSESEEDDE